MRPVIVRWLLLAVAVVGLSALAANKELQCKESCVEMAKVCVDSCKQQVKKKAPQTIPYCAPKCNEIKLSCDKECEDDAVKHKPKH